jgi:hypothetical protein
LPKIKSMLKLYKVIENQLHYWETWETGENSGLIHKGIAGDRGKDQEVKTDYRNVIDRELERLVKEGYDEILPEDMDTLLIEFKPKGATAKTAPEHWERLEELLDNGLGWVGLGHCEGTEEENGIMTVVCEVVDYSLAAAYIKAGLDDSEFKDYERVYQGE